MKLYTEEQIIKAFMAGSDFVWDDTGEYSQGVCDYVKSLTPIELPSDEEIENAATHLEPSVTRRAFQSGAKWMRDKILNK